MYGLKDSFDKKVSFISIKSSVGVYLERSFYDAIITSNNTLVFSLPDKLSKGK